MLDPARLERIWEREPDLRPTLAGTEAADNEPVWLHVRLFDDQRSFWFANERGTVGLSRWVVHPDLAAALIRDRCVWWLVDREWQDGSYLTIDREDGGPARWSVGSGLDDGPFAPDPTTALLVAVERVLGIEEVA